MVQLIADGVHVAPEAILTAWRAARGRTVLVSRRDRRSRPRRRHVPPRAARGDGRGRGVAQRTTGRWPAAVRPLAWGVRMLIELGVPIVEAVDTVTGAPARLFWREDIGVLRQGAPADLVVLDDDFAVERVYVGGMLLE